MADPDPRSSGPPAGYRYLGLGVQFAVSIILFVLVGQWVDRKLGTGGLFTLVGALLGFGAILYSLMRDLKRDLETEERRKKGSGDG